MLGIDRSPWLTGLAATFAAVWFSASAAAVEFQVHRTDSGIQAIVVVGEFESSSEIERFRLLTRSSQFDLVTFDSGGGSIVAALELGRAIRQAGLPTFQPRLLECASACAFAFLGGVRRDAEPGSIGVHRASFDEGSPVDPDRHLDTFQELMAEVMAYIDEMGADPALLELSMRYDAADIRYLSGSEMDEYRITTNGAATGSRGSADFPTARFDDPSDMPEAISGRVRHPKGSAPLKSFPEESAPSLTVVRNGTPINVLTNDGRWYGVRINGTSGYLHHSWVAIDQFEQVADGERFIQVKSFAEYAEAERYVMASRLSLAAYLATNGWYAITLAEPLAREAAADRLAEMKSRGDIPNDSYITFGNGYVRRVCCD